MGFSSPNAPASGSAGSSGARASRNPPAKRSVGGAHRRRRLHLLLLLNRRIRWTKVIQVSMRSRLFFAHRRRQQAPTRRWAATKIGDSWRWGRPFGAGRGTSWTGFGPPFAGTKCRSSMKRRWEGLKSRLGLSEFWESAFGSSTIVALQPMVAAQSSDFAKGGRSRPHVSVVTMTPHYNAILILRAPPRCSKHKQNLSPLLAILLLLFADAFGPAWIRACLRLSR